jgi:thioredoxin reductase
LQSGDTILPRRVIFATGMYDDLPPLEGLNRLWGKRVFVCPYCDAWEFRDRRMAVIGNVRSALELAQELWNWSHDLVICPTSNAPVPHELRQWQLAADVPKTASPPAKMNERDGMIAVECANGEVVDCAVVFVSAPLKQRSDLPARLGCDMTERCTIRVDANNRTTVPGCFAAGDCITRYHQIVFAASSGARAAIAINEELYEADARALAETSAEKIPLTG